MSAMKIPLTKGYEALVSPEDYEVLSRYRWCAQTRSDNCGVYAKRAYGEGGRHKTMFMHHQITGLKFVDHKNRNTLDNTRENLRAANKSLNSANRSTVSKTTGFRGVSTNKSKTKPFRACVSSGRKTIWAGYYETAKDAARGYDANAIRLFGDFAVTNASLGLLPDWAEGGR